MTFSKFLVPAVLLVSSLVMVQRAVAEEKPFESILFVGDSHSTGNFGKTLDAYLRTLSPKVTSVASCGSSPSNWMGTGKTYKPTICGYWRKESNGKEISVKSHAIDLFPDEIKKAQPDLTVVALGTNILASPANIQKELPIMESMLKEIKKAGSRCVWVGPPDAQKQPFAANVSLGAGMMKTLAEKYDCQFVDSSKLTKYPAGKGDGIHYGGKDATDWGKKVVSEINDTKIVEVKKETPKPQEKNDADWRRSAIQ